MYALVLFFFCVSLIFSYRILHETCLNLNTAQFYLTIKTNFFSYPYLIGLHYLLLYFVLVVYAPVSTYIIFVLLSTTFFGRNAYIMRLTVVNPPSICLSLYFQTTSSSWTSTASDAEAHLRQFGETDSLILARHTSDSSFNQHQHHNV